MNEQTNPSPKSNETAPPADEAVTKQTADAPSESAAEESNAEPETAKTAPAVEPETNVTGDKKSETPIPEAGEDSPAEDSLEEGRPEQATPSPTDPPATQEIPEREIQRVKSSNLQQLTWWQKMVPGKKRDAQLADIQSGYSEVLGLVRSMRDNLDAQTVGQVKLVQFMSELPGVAEGLRHVGEAAQQQKEMLGVIKEQLEVSTVQNANIVTSMDKFNGTLHSMDDTTRKILEGARDSEDSLKEMLERSERRLMWMTSLAIILLLAIGGAVFYLFYDGKLMVGPYAQQGVMAVPAESLAAAVEQKPPSGNIAVITVTDFKKVPWSMDELDRPASNAEESEAPAIADEHAVSEKSEAVEEDVKPPVDAGNDASTKRKKWFNINLFGQKAGEGAMAVEAVAEKVAPVAEEPETVDVKAVEDIVDPVDAGQPAEKAVEEVPAKDLPSDS